MSYTIVLIELFSLSLITDFRCLALPHASMCMFGFVDYIASHLQVILSSYMYSVS